jgi:hypothetical protein
MTDHWVTNCDDFQDGDITVMFKSDVDCTTCLKKLQQASKEGLVEDRIIPATPAEKKHVLPQIFDFITKLQTLIGNEAEVVCKRWLSLHSCGLVGSGFPCRT